MKCYEPTLGRDDEAPYAMMAEDPHGEWVKKEDVLKLKAAISDCVKELGKVPGGGAWPVKESLDIICRRLERLSRDDE